MSGAGGQIPLMRGEHIEDLQYNSLKIIQSRDAYRFGTDAVLLSGFARLSRAARAVDLGAGSGVLSILLNSTWGCAFTAVEQDAEQCSRIRRSALLNAQSGISVENIDLHDAPALLGRGRFDAVVCNPPYFPPAGAPSRFSAARHELTASIASIAAISGALLKFGGKLFLCFAAQRLCEAITSLCSAGLEPKRLRFVASRAEKPPYLVLIEARRGAKPGLILEPVLIIHSPDGDYTEEVKRIYHYDRT